jgi:hypothetical protein
LISWSGFITGAVVVLPAKDDESASGSVLPASPELKLLHTRLDVGRSAAAATTTASRAAVVALAAGSTNAERTVTAGISGADVAVAAATGKALEIPRSARATRNNRDFRNAARHSKDLALTPIIKRA